MHLFLLLHTSSNEEPYPASDAHLSLVTTAHACSVLSMWSCKACMCVLLFDLFICEPLRRILFCKNELTQNSGLCVEA